MKDNSEYYWKCIADRAEALSINAHDGQFRRDGVTPYTAHTKAVVKILCRLAIQFNWDMITLYRRCAIGHLHDTKEDTNMTLDDLSNKGIPLAVRQGVDILSKRPDEEYDDFISRILPHEDERWVKIADILANLGDDPTPKQMIKYGKALVTLNTCHTIS